MQQPVDNYVVMFSTESVASSMQPNQRLHNEDQWEKLVAVESVRASDS
jgi:hypothetical protein